MKYPHHKIVIVLLNDTKGLPINQSVNRKMSISFGKLHCAVDKLQFMYISLCLSSESAIFEQWCYILDFDWLILVFSTISAIIQPDNGSQAYLFTGSSYLSCWQPKVPDDIFALFSLQFNSSYAY